MVSKKENFIYRYSKKHVNWLLTCLLSSFILIALNIYRAVITGDIVNFSLQNNTGEIFEQIMILLVTILVGAILGFLTKYASATFAAKMSADIRTDIVNRISNIKMGTLRKLTLGDIQTRIDWDTDSIERFMKNDLQSMFIQPLMAVIASAFILFIDWRLFVISFIFTPIGMIIAYQLNKKAGKCYPRRGELFSLANNEFTQTVSGIDIVKTYKLSHLFKRRTEKALLELLEEEQKILKYVSLLQPICTAIAWFPRLTFIIYGGYLVLNNEINAGIVVASIQLLEFIVGPTVWFPFALNSFNETKASVRRVIDLLNKPVETNQKQKVEDLSFKKGAYELNGPSLCFRNVSFNYDTENREKGLNSINLKVFHNSKVAIVGPSGSGKSTLVDLIVRLNDPDEGIIEIFGQNIEHYDLNVLRENIAVVSQNTELLSGTISQNIVFGKLNITDEKIIEAAKKAGAHDFIMKLKDGYNTILGENGINLSGGQRQRIAIARAFFKDSPILILDEPTASLDSQIINTIQNSLKQLQFGRTVIVISHRLSEIQDANNIFVIKDGEILEDGTHQQLIKNEGIYFEMYEQKVVKEI
ncbi:ABC transporter ATP-binding protein [Paenibacillus sp. FSL H3-0457]|uniref:ABC transporter ATP-binding protein n=1 Tax=Paenibacillus sp. FSL H3-0457 TaxID=2921430 RepID=UPI0030ED2136